VTLNVKSLSVLERD